MNGWVDTLGKAPYFNLWPNLNTDCGDNIGRRLRELGSGLIPATS